MTLVRRGQAGRRVRAWLLALALLPSLSFLGHWMVEIPIPGTAQHFVVGVRAGSHGVQESDGHAGHCHADSAECGDAPAPAMGLAIGALAGAVAIALAGITLLWPVTAGGHALHGVSVRREPVPPRAAASLA